MLALVLIVVLFIYLYIKYKYSYWKRQAIPYLTPIFPIGNCPLTLSTGFGIGGITTKYYDEFKSLGCKMGGIYFGLKPVLVINDPNYAEDILKTDFSYFTDRRLHLDKNCPVTVNVATQRGEDWKMSRAKFSHAFTSLKMKMMFDTLKLCSKDLETHLAEHAESDKYLNIIEAISWYNTDVMASVLFGVECKSFKEETNSPFKDLGKLIFSEFPLHHKIQSYLCNYFPEIAKIFGVSNIPDDVSEFFNSYVKEVVNYRKNNNVYRKDFLQTLMEMKEEYKLSLQDIAAQAFIFYAGGFETSARTSTFLLFELGLNPNIQEKIRSEVKAVCEKYNNDLTIEAINEMTLLDQAFEETMRRYTPGPTLSRICTSDYKLKGTNYTIPKGLPVLFPVMGYQLDPDYYPDPMKWDPYRFSNKEKKHLGNLPFGDGPRNCVGLRFGMLQVKMGVISVLRDYEVTVDPSIKVPLELELNSFVLQTKETILIKLHKL